MTYFFVFFFKCKAILHKTLKFYPCKFTDLLIFYTLTDDGLFMYIREEIWQTSLVNTFLFVLLYSIGLCINTVFNHDMMKKTWSVLQIENITIKS